MRILGIDPGYATIGYGIIEYDNFRFKTITYGAIITTPKDAFVDRLCSIYDDITTLVNTYHPDCLSIEKLFFNFIFSIIINQYIIYIHLCFVIYSIPFIIS